MKYHVLDDNDLIQMIHLEVKKFERANRIMEYVELTDAEYDTLRTKLEVPLDHHIIQIPPSGVELRLRDKDTGELYNPGRRALEERKGARIQKVDAADNIFGGKK